MLDFTESILIEARPSRVWAALLDIEQWWPGSRSVEGVSIYVPLSTGGHEMSRLGRALPTRACPRHGRGVPKWRPPFSRMPSSLPNLPL